jgi:hypothetical protein
MAAALVAFADCCGPDRGGGGPRWRGWPRSSRRGGGVGVADYADRCGPACHGSKSARPAGVTLVKAPVGGAPAALAQCLARRGVGSAEPGGRGSGQAYVDCCGRDGGHTSPRWRGAQPGGVQEPRRRVGRGAGRAYVDCCGRDRGHTSPRWRGARPGGCVVARSAVGACAGEAYVDCCGRDGGHTSPRWRGARPGGCVVARSAVGAWAGQAYVDCCGRYRGRVGPR